MEATDLHLDRRLDPEVKSEARLRQEASIS